MKVFVNVSLSSVPSGTCNSLEKVQQSFLYEGKSNLHIFCKKLLMKLNSQIAKKPISGKTLGSKVVIKKW